VLIVLLESSGDIVARDELRRRLWGDRPFLDHDAALNTAMRKVREALGDSPTDPRYVETVARHGYRFLAPVSSETAPPLFAAAEVAPAPRLLPPVEQASELRPVLESIETAPATPSAHRRASRAALALTIGFAALALAGGAWWALHRHATDSSSLPELLSVTAARGYNGQPAISPDGASVAFVSDRTGPLEIYVTGRAPGSRTVAITADG